MHSCRTQLTRFLALVHACMQADAGGANDPAPAAVEPLTAAKQGAAVPVSAAAIDVGPKAAAAKVRAGR